MRKEIKTCIDFYINNINSDDYKKHLERSKKEGDKYHQEFILTEKPSWASRTDYFDNYMIASMVIGDVLSNDGITHLLKKLYSLPKKEYRVKNYYKKPTWRNKYDYVKLQYTHSDIGRFSEIEFLKDKYIERIEIRWSQINNYFAYIEYTFWFRKCLDETLYNDFIIENLNKLTSKDYIIWYHIRDKKEDNYLSLSQMNSEFFNIICQHYITTLLYSEQGKNCSLISIVFGIREQAIDIDTLYIGDFGKAFYNREKNYVIVGDFEHDNYLLCSGNNSIPNFSVCDYISEYGNEFFYKFFGQRELKIFEQDFSRYSNGRVKIRYNKKIKQLLKKIQSVSDYDDYLKTAEIYSEFNKSWDFYTGNDKEDIKVWQNKSTEDYRTIYEKNFSYLKMLTEMNYTKSNHMISVFATIISVVATIISLIAIFE